MRAAGSARQRINATSRPLQLAGTRQASQYYGRYAERNDVARAEQPASARESQYCPLMCRAGGRPHGRQHVAKTHYLSTNNVIAQQPQSDDMRTRDIGAS